MCCKFHYTGLRLTLVYCFDAEFQYYVNCLFTVDFYAQKQLLLQRVLAITILSIRLSVCHTSGSVKSGAS